ncbi:squalene synthase HpnC [Lentzea tibetensis]|uniref:Squalene synthase HpnC n=1 Tax=Lentzea tibetensis TaxID=2591470 RepID=A0A563ELJ3_9PSEU|nr:squalene synthase HpnC [Lentzea tibetensis]TWP48112.1 squalene synthase HpnC [Lentzea tibetensis]
MLDQAASENLPVAARVLPRAVRGHLVSIHGYCRLVDDLGDEASGDRLSLLDAAERELGRVYDGTPRSPAFLALQETVRACGIPREPLQDLISANRMDQHQRDYADFAALTSYCALSANPVGRLVLHVFGVATDENIALSDPICTALQLLERLLDVSEDYHRGRVYLPRQDMRLFGCTTLDLACYRTSPAARAVVEYETARADQLLTAGSPLIGRLRGFARIAVAGYVAGGRATAAALRRNDFDVLGQEIKPSRTGALTQWAQLLVRSR